MCIMSVDNITNKDYVYSIGSWHELPYEVKQEWYSIFEYNASGERVFPSKGSSMYKYTKMYTNVDKTMWTWIQVGHNG